MLTLAFRVARPPTFLRVASMRFCQLAICTAAVVLLSAATSLAQSETRYGIWDNSTNPNNVMTYEPFEKGGMKITVSNPSDPKATWWYTTHFDGKFAPVNGQKNSETAVEVINDKST